MKTAGTNILVVEDEGIVAKDIQNCLERLGHGVPAVVDSGDRAIEEAESKRPDLVLMDIRLKGDMLGTEAAGQIWSRFDIPVVYLTAYADQETVQAAKQAEPYGYILKPFDEQDLGTTIEMALHKHRKEQEARRFSTQLVSGATPGSDGATGLGSGPSFQQSAQRDHGQFDTCRKEGEPRGVGEISERFDVCRGSGGGSGPGAQSVLSQARI